MDIPEDTIAIACADLHLDEFAWSDRRAIHGDSMWSFKWIMDLSQEHDLPVIMAGDVLDKPINNATVANFIRLNITKSSLVAFIQGQHCRQQMTPWLSALDDFYENEPVTHWLGDKSYDDGFGYAKIHGVVFRGIDWTPSNELPARVAAVPEDTDVLVMHQVTKQFMSELVDVKTFEFDVTTVPHAKLVIVGDFHRTRVVDVTGASGQKIAVISPGSSHMRSIDEPADKYVFAIKKDLSFEKIQIPTRPKLEYKIESEEDMNTFVGNVAFQLDDASAKIADKAPNHICKPLIRVHFNPDLDGAYDRIEEAVGDYGHLFTTPLQGPEKGQIEPDERPMLERFGTAEILSRRLDPEKEPEAFSLASRLLQDPNPKQVLAEERSKYIH